MRGADLQRSIPPGNHIQHHNVRLRLGIHICSLSVLRLPIYHLILDNELHSLQYTLDLSLLVIRDNHGVALRGVSAPPTAADENVYRHEELI